MLLVNTYQKSTNSFLNSFVKRILFILLCGTYFCVAGCGGNDKETLETTSESVTAEEVTSIEKVSTDDIAKELQANKEKWNSHEITDYSIEMQHICFCPPEAVRLMIFEIKNNEIRSVRYADTDEYVEAGYFNDYNTVNGLFELAEQAITKNPHEITISYDEEFGFIKELSIDYEYQIADEEVTIITSSMRPSS